MFPGAHFEAVIFQIFPRGSFEGLQNKILRRKLFLEKKFFKLKIKFFSFSDKYLIIENFYNKKKNLNSGSMDLNINN